ncbi:MAG: hypothetical protein HYS81_04555 [Candidatus Aenigmatarchaeota archaeon]|nr:MAG: hypothetical protein HYS81_04555 [Candidatus Aenigmarchaeota archaeon]
MVNELGTDEESPSYFIPGAPAKRKKWAQSWDWSTDRAYIQRMGDVLAGNPAYEGHAKLVGGR